VKTFGSEFIVNAWLLCMNGGGDFRVRFQVRPDPQNNDVDLILEYPRSGGLHPRAQEDLTLEADIDLPTDVTARDPTECLKKNKVFKPGDSCIVPLSVPGPWRTFGVKARLVGTNSITFPAYLATRARLVWDVKPFSAIGEASFHTPPRTRDRETKAEPGYSTAGKSSHWTQQARH
jgi:hypothetical protein